MISAKNVSKTYGNFTALHNLNIKVNSGDIFCLLGANGAGKTTTINLFLNFINPSSGEIQINDLSVTAHPVETKKFIAYVPENLMLYPNLTGIENLRYFSRLAGKSHAKEYMEQLLAEAGLQSDAFYRRVSNYSKGMRQKVGIAIALAKDAKALLLDEPTSGLDPKASNEFSELLIKLREDGMAILMATHDLFRAQDTGSHIGIMKNGHLLENLKTTETTLQDLEKLYLHHMNN